MSGFSKFRARWAVAFYWLILILLLSYCATVPSSQKHVNLVLNPKSSHQIEESFQVLWEKRTVNFGMEMRNGKSFQLGIPFMGSGGRGEDSEFPIQITATLMDSLIIEAGLKHYASLLAMTPEKEREFRNAYFQRYDVENHLLIWCELQTSWAELHLDLDRWTIFIEDDAGNQYEPLQILEESPPIRPTTRDMFPDFLSTQGRRAREFHQKVLMLCYPRCDFYQNLVLSDRAQFLKLVFQSTDDPKTKAEGVWTFK